MMKRLMTWIASKLPPPRIIFDQDGLSPYLSRYYLRGKPTMPDGSTPFTEAGDPKPGAIWPKGDGIGVYIHRFHRGDNDRELHNHPWRWAVSFVLAGGYWEERRVGDDVFVREVRPGHINILSANSFHRVTLRDGDAWTLFVVGPKVSGWGFWKQDDGSFTPWREFLSRKRDPTMFERGSL